LKRSFENGRIIIWYLELARAGAADADERNARPRLPVRHTEHTDGGAADCHAGLAGRHVDHACRDAVAAIGTASIDPGATGFRATAVADYAGAAATNGPSARVEPDDDAGPDAELADAAPLSVQRLMSSQQTWPGLPAQYFGNSGPSIVSNPPGNPFDSFNPLFRR
jgi:hypothetical protein